MKTPKTTLLILLLLLLAGCTVTGDDTPTPLPATDTAAPATDTAAPPTDTVAPPTAAPATDAPTVEAGPTATTAGEPAAGLCNEIPRPAVVLFIPGQNYVVVDPATGQSCDLTLPDPAPGILEVANGQLFYHAREGDNLTIKRLAAAGTAEALAYTTFNVVEQPVYQDFAVSPDGRYIAWSYAGNKVDEPATIVSNLWIAELATGTITGHLEEFAGIEQGPSALVPIRFSQDGNTLFYTHQPIGIGGSWIAFVGRYDDLYSTPSAGGAVTELFNCDGRARLLCLGDFFVLDGRATTLVYTNDETKEIVVLNGAGETLNTIPVDAEYVGYPTISESGEIAFYTATLGDSFPNPSDAAINRIAPPTAPPEVVAQDPNLLLPQAFLDGSRLVVSYVTTGSSWGTAVVDMTSAAVTPLTQWPESTFVGVLPAGQ
jgi:hypothetical protein